MASLSPNQELLVGYRGIGGEQPSLNDRFLQARWKFVVAVFVTGLFNNNGYVMVAAGADSLAKDFDKKDLMPMFQLSLIVFSILTLFLNAKFLLRTQHKSRIIAVTATIVVSFAFIALSCFYSDELSMFYLSLLAAVIIGVGCALGQSTFLGFLKSFPGECIGYYSSGTGFAGISGALILILLSAAGMSRGAIYLSMVPTAIPYLVAFLWLDKQKSLYPNVSISTNYDCNELTAVNEISPMSQVTAVEVLQKQSLVEEGVVDNATFEWASSKRVFQKVGMLMANLALVYFLEYTITTSFTVGCMRQILLLHPSRKDDFVYSNAYMIFNFCYQLGVFVSRSSLSILKVRRTWIITLLQFGFFVFFLANSLVMFCDNIYLLFSLMVFVGLMGGASFVNVYYQIKQSDSLLSTEKELALNLSNMSNDFGTLLASLTALTLSLTVFSQE